MTDDDLSSAFRLSIQSAIACGNMIEKTPKDQNIRSIQRAIFFFLSFSWEDEDDEDEDDEG